MHIKGWWVNSITGGTGCPLDPTIGIGKTLTEAFNEHGINFTFLGCWVIFATEDDRNMALMIWGD